METNNISTIATFLAICITGILAYFGYTVDQAQLAAVLMSVITLIIAVWSSKNPILKKTHTMFLGLHNILIRKDYVR